MPKKTETEETRLFCHILLLMVFRLEGADPLAHPGYAYDCNLNALCDIKILCAFLLVCPCEHAKATLMVLFCMIMKNM